jgi:hypothetical protein
MRTNDSSFAIVGRMKVRSSGAKCWLGGLDNALTRLERNATKNMTERSLENYPLCSGQP